MLNGSRKTERELACNLLRVLWLPREKDRVIIRDLKGLLRRAVIVGSYKGLYLTTLGREMFIMPQMRYVPSHQQALSFLEEMKAEGVIDFDFKEDGSIQAVRRYKRYNYTTNQIDTVMLCAEGSAFKVIASLLESRKVDSELNETFNRKVEKVVEIKNKNFVLMQ